MSARRDRALAILQATVVLPTLACIAGGVAKDAHRLTPLLALWVVVVAGVGLLPVPVWRGMHVSMDFPVLLAAGIVFPPFLAAGIALLGATDPRELRHEVSLLRALFNRAQVSLAVLAASGVFHLFASARSSWGIVLLVALIASVTDYLVNATLVSLAVKTAYGTPFLEALKSLRIGQSAEFLVNYIGLGFVGTALAKLYIDPLIGAWALPTTLMPLVFARQMFFRSRALEEAHKELKEREQVLAALSDRMAEERQDERAQIAAYLHDDLAQLLFRLSLQVDLAKRHLRAGDTQHAEDDLELIRQTKNRTSEMVRALIRDLHRSPLGRAGLAEALASFTGDLADGSGIRFHTEIEPVALPPAMQLIAYHIAREAAMNALKHSLAQNVWITLCQDDEGVDLTVRDDGAGFDPDSPPPEGHFGLPMMRERAQVAAGAFTLNTAPGEGTTVRVHWPAAWIKENQEGSSGPGEDLVPVAEPAPTREPAPSATVRPASTESPPGDVAEDASEPGPARRPVSA
jgi:signal transduction histidine kinase